MRDIKFRAWNGEKVIYHLVISFDGTDNAVWLDGSLDGSEPHAWKEEGLMQFTGLIDKNGADIYEGDTDSEGWTISFVSDTNGSLGMSAGWYLQRNDFESWTELECGADIEIVGNIYESKGKL